MARTKVAQRNTDLIVAKGGIDYVCDTLATGDNLRDIARAIGVNHHALHRWVQREENVEQYEAANRARAELIIAEIDEIVDDPTLGNYTDKEGNIRVDSGSVNRAKLRIEHRHWLAGKLDPDAYGEKDKNNVQINLNNIHLNALRSAKDSKVIDG
jgi:transposase-like protein